MLYATDAGALACAVTVSWPKAAIAVRRALNAGSSLAQARTAITMHGSAAGSPR